MVLAISQNSRVAVVGTGITGMTIAWLLHRAGHEVVVYEKEDYIGGHTHTVDVNLSKEGTRLSQPVDTGFIVFNDVTYPHLIQLFKFLDVKTEDSNMSFAVSFETPTGITEWAGDSLGTIFAQKKNMLRPSFLLMLFDMLRFNRSITQIVREKVSHESQRMTIRDFLIRGKYSDSFRTLYLLPMLAAIWSAPMNVMLEFPLITLARFMTNHGMAQIFSRPQWRTVTGGSREYVKKLTADFKEKILLSSAVTKVERQGDKVVVKDRTGGEERYDHVVVAAHGDQALRLLADPSDEEVRILGRIEYQKNRAVLHTDTSLAPRDKAIWASWNYMADTRAGQDAMDLDVSVTYWMNRLQNIDKSYPLFVSINPLRQPRDDLVYGTWEYEHPVYTLPAVQSQRELPSIQGTRRTWYCGAWCGFGFHEDGLAAAWDVAEAMGLPLPWQLPEYHRRQRLTRAGQHAIAAPDAHVFPYPAALELTLSAMLGVSVRVLRAAVAVETLLSASWRLCRRLLSPFSALRQKSA